MKDRVYKLVRGGTNPERPGFSFKFRSAHPNLPDMDITETLYVTSREDWRAWLEAHHERRPEIWLVSYRKGTGRPSLPYNDAVEEALCFGWIDSIQKGLDQDRYVQRYSPRRRGTRYSQINLERIARLASRGLVLPGVLEGLGDVRAEGFEFPRDIMEELASDTEAWAFFQQTSLPYQRIRVSWVDEARDRPEEFQKRLRHLLEKSRQKKQFGYDIQSYY